jgi:predicted histone-like DNA-binding protein
MSIKYKVVKQVFGFDETKTAKYVVKPVTGEMLAFDKVRVQVVQICGVHRGTVNLVLDGLLDVMVNSLDMGHSVQLGDFGAFRPGIRAKAQNNEKAANADTVYRRKVNFVPGKRLKNFLKDVAVTRMAAIDEDYTDGSGTGGNTGGGNSGSGDNNNTYIDPNT